MSRIFDALQRSERERSGIDSAALPEGPELLKRAERQAISQWSDNLELKGRPISAPADFSALLKAGVELSDPPSTAEAANPECISLNWPRGEFNHFEILPILLSAQSRLVCLTDRESPTAEALRLLGVRLKDFRRVRTLKKVLITSVIPQEGKSTIAGNLACTLSFSLHERTLLVEGDLRRPSLSAMFGIPPVPGICDCLREGISLDRSIYRLEGAGPWIWPAGHTPSNPLDLLHSPKLPILMDQLATYFDWIVIDSPPVLPLADTSVWMRLADGILLVTRKGTTEKQQLRKGLEALDPVKTLGALLNGTTASAYSSYYYRKTSQS